MAPDPKVQDAPQLRTDAKNHLVIETTWKEAERLQTYLGKRDMPTTLVLDPVERRAHLEVWPGVSEEEVRAALRPWPGGARLPLQA
jgi:hypothetical protein